MPPPAEGFAARFVVGPALRTQPDRRLVALVREGYENAFDEIVRRYGRPLNRYAGAIVGNRAEDVTQDAFSKALLSLRRSDKEIELRPWLFRIVRNTALNDLRDRPPSVEVIAEAIAGSSNPAEELERREEMTDLMRRLGSLPEAQRAAIVMRELEGLSHDEIAKALGLSGGAARQAIFRARQKLRDGLGMLLPLPLLKGLLAGTAGAPAEAAAGAAGIGGGAAGASVALKAAAATVLVAGAVGTGVAIDHGRHEAGLGGAAAEARQVVDDQIPVRDEPATETVLRSKSGRDDSGGHRGGASEPGDDRRGRSDDHGGSSGPGPSSGRGPRSESDGPEGGSGSSGHLLEAHDDHGGEGSSGPGEGSGQPSGGGSGGSGSGISPDGSGSSSGSGDSGSGSSGGSSDGGGSLDSSGPGGGSSPAPEEPVTKTGSGSSGGSGSSSDGSSDSGSSSTPGGSGDPRDSGGGSGFSLQTEPQS